MSEPTALELARWIISEHIRLPIGNGPCECNSCVLAREVIRLSEREARLVEDEPTDVATWRRAAIQAKDDLRAIERALGEGHPPVGPGCVFAAWSSPANTMRWIEQMQAEEQIGRLMEEIEGAWMERGDGSVVDRIAAEHPHLAERLRQFFADVVSATDLTESRTTPEPEVTP